MRKVALIGGIVASVAVGATAPAQAPNPICEGSWVGSKVGPPGYNGPLTVKFDDGCAYSWIGSGGLVTKGKLTFQGRNIYYQNEAGSQGKVTQTGSTLEFRNTYTGDSYTVKVQKQN